MDTFASSLLDGAIQKQEERELATVAGEAEGGGNTYLTIQFADEVWEETITKGTQNRTILIDKAALI